MKHFSSIQKPKSTDSLTDHRTVNPPHRNLGTIERIEMKFGTLPPLSPSRSPRNGFDKFNRIHDPGP